MKAIFLDIDGVLNSHRTAIAYGGVSWSGEAGIRGKMDDVAVRLIGGIARLAGAQIVLSSSWRSDVNWLAIGPQLDMEITERTPRLAASRGEEIQDWLDAHPEIERFAIIDDDADILPEHQPYFIHTSMFDGFNWANALRLADLMGISIFDVNHPGQRLPKPTTGSSAGSATKQHGRSRAVDKTTHKMVPPWKAGDEYRPYHPSASHCSPDYRAGWNDCFAAAPAPQPLAPDAWQDIASAPKDYGVTEFDVWANGVRVPDCWWGRPTYGPKKKVDCIVHRSDYDCNGPVDEEVTNATHWQPLPAPPAAALPKETPP